MKHCVPKAIHSMTPLSPLPLLTPLAWISVHGLSVWSVETGNVVKRLAAHFQRIVEMKSLVTGSDNCVLTSSIDRSIKVWNLDYIFEKEQHIDKHELTIDSVSISTSAQIAVVVTRSCIGT